MQNLNLTKWLEMVWNALQETDAAKRDRLLQSAEKFLKREKRSVHGALPVLPRQRRAA
jgi:hypothetical protein